MQQYKSIIIGSVLLMSAGFASRKKVLTVAAYPAVDQIVKDSLAVWSKDNPDVEVKVVGREYSDHHTAMTTALARLLVFGHYDYRVWLSGRFANSGGFENLLDAPYSAGNIKMRLFHSHGLRLITRNMVRPYCRPISVPEPCFIEPTMKAAGVTESI